MTCPQCEHPVHVGICGQQHIVQSTQIDCACVTIPAEMAEQITLGLLRRKDAEQQRRMADLKAKDRLSTQPRPTYRRM